MQVGVYIGCLHGILYIGVVVQDGHAGAEQSLVIPTNDMFKSLFVPVEDGPYQDLIRDLTYLQGFLLDHILHWMPESQKGYKKYYFRLCDPFGGSFL